MGSDLWPHNLKDTGYIKNNFILGLIDVAVKKIYNLSDLILCQSDSFRNLIKKKLKLKLKHFIILQITIFVKLKIKKNIIIFKFFMQEI